MKWSIGIIEFLIIIGTVVSCKSTTLPYLKKDFIAVHKPYGFYKVNRVMSPTKFYKGIEVELKEGAVIKSIANGIVKEVCNTCNRGFGNYVLIEHNDSVQIKYYHLSQISIQEGDSVLKGQTIGVAGNTGLTTVTGVGIRKWVNDSLVNPLK